MEFPHVAIVILNWNGKNFLEKFLPSVMAVTYPSFRVIVADNFSTDDSINFLQMSYPQVEIIALDRNYGFAEGYNQALKQVQADYYLLLNSDVEPQPGFLEHMVKLMESNINIAACQPKVLSFSPKNKFEYAGASGGWMDALGYPFSRGRIFDICEDDNGQYNDSQPVFWATGASFLIRPRVFHMHNGFDPYFFAHQEEIDLCWRIQRGGMQVWVCPQSIIYHVGGGTLQKTNPFKNYLNFRNNLIMLARNLPFYKKIYVFPLRYGLDGVAALQLLFRGNIASCMAILKAHLGFIVWCFKGQQHGLKAPRKVKLNGWYKGSIVFSFFAKKKQYFSQIVGSKK